MGVNGTYNLMITDLGDDEIDLDYVLFQLRRDFEDAKYFLNEKGTSSGSEGYWDNIEQDLCDFSRKHMTLRFLSISRSNMTILRKSASMSRTGSRCYSSL